MSKFRAVPFLVVALALASACEVRAQRNDRRPTDLEGLEIVEHLDEQVPMDLGFRDDGGQNVRLGDYFDGTKPVVLSMNYSDCPMLCNLQLNGLFASMKNLALTPGEDFEFVSVSINPLETTDRARIAKNGYVRTLGDAKAAKGLHFLTGSKANVEALAAALGFPYRFLPETREYAHPAVLEICTPDGRISRYLYGVEFPVQDLRLSLVEASEGKIGTSFDRFLLFCYHYDAERGYTLFAQNLMKLAGALTVFVVAIFIVPYWFMKGSARPPGAGAGESASTPGKSLSAAANLARQSPSGPSPPSE